MAMVGHRTESVYRRYAIADEAMLKEGAVKLAAFHAAEKMIRAQSVVPIGLYPNVGAFMSRVRG
jgi:hypothetical protein